MGEDDNKVVVLGAGAVRFLGFGEASGSSRCR